MKTITCATLAFLLLTAGCKELDKNVSEEKFGALEVAWGSLVKEFKRVDYLTKNVHADSLQIVYGFAANADLDKDCSNSKILFKDKSLLTEEENKEREEVISYVEDKIAWAVDTWLAPLRKLKLNKKIVAKENFEFIELAPTKFEEIEGVFLEEMLRFGYSADYLKTHNLLDKADLMVVFSCKWGGFAVPSGVTKYYFPKQSRRPPDIFMSDGFRSKIQGYRKSWEFTLLHEIGHAFGLVDTYITDLGGRGIIYDARGQSLSVMSSSAGLIEAQRKTGFSLMPDDIKGIKWLYYYYHDKEKLRKNECFFADYEVVQSRYGKTCRPMHPIIHAIHQAHIRERHVDLEEAVAYLSSIYSIVDELKMAEEKFKTDKYGRTALHYAVIHEGESTKLKLCWRNAIRKLLEEGFDKSITDSSGKTACDYLQCNDDQAEEGKTPCDYLQDNDESAEKIKCSEINKLLCSGDTQ